MFWLKNFKVEKKDVFFTFWKFKNKLIIVYFSYGVLLLGILV